MQLYPCVCVNVLVFLSCLCFFQRGFLDVHEVSSVAHGVLVGHEVSVNKSEEYLKHTSSFPKIRLKVLFEIVVVHQG